MYCPNCGKQIKDGSTFCGYCGAPIKENSSPVSVQQSSTDLSEFKQLGNCFTKPFSDESLSVPVSIIVFAGMFLINWFTFFGQIECGVGVTAIVLAGIYLLEYFDEGQMWDGRKATGKIAFRLVLPSVLMFAGGAFIRYYGHAMTKSLQSYSVFGNTGSSSPGEGPVYIGLFLILLSVISFIMIETHGLHKNSTGFIYVKILIVTVIVVASIVLVGKVSADNAVDAIMSLF